uniref:Metallothionein 1 n=1 Tax=Laccaria bicolor TaxID=29883 RepID=A0A0F6MXI6_LACBI|nr:metallothionein 1 [Laccaria bicolor]
MISTINVPVSQTCGSSSCNCGESCACKPGECKC